MIVVIESRVVCAALEIPNFQVHTVEPENIVNLITDLAPGATLPCPSPVHMHHGGKKNPSTELNFTM
jgi:hypothetical protein